MTKPAPVVAASSSALERWQAPAAPFAAWLDFDRRYGEAEQQTVSRLISDGCRVLMITGLEHEAIHESVDWIALDATKDLVLTMSETTISEESALAFLSTRCPRATCSVRVISSFSESLATEISRLGQMVDAIEAADSDSF
jgi:hypothetical protein